jgi:acetyl-CoA carboxylase biotin carboxylase subunit
MSFTKILIANRGEIAVRVARTCREMGIATVAVYSTADRDSTVVRIADEAVHIGPPAARRSYLSMPAVIEAARGTGAQAIHPGYGFLSEDPDFAEVCADNELVFIGPSPDVMRTLADKATTRAVMRDAGLPLLPGTVAAVATVAEATAEADRVGYPVILKAVAGGGGRGMSIVHAKADLAAQFARTRVTAAAVFGDGRIYLERYLAGARHIEVQVLCDRYGNGVHIGDRDCSTQRRHQKLVEEAPAPNLPEDTRAAMHAAALHGAQAVAFSGVGTMEFLVDADGGFYLMEMNARLQVEHPVTEMVTGIDLVEQQIRVACGERLVLRQRDVVLRGSAVECRINAEDPDHDFRPTPGPVERFLAPGGAFTRVDTHVFPGYVVPPHYDSLLAKLVVWAPDRPAALARARRALDELVIDGPQLRTTTSFAARVLDHPMFRAARHTTELVDLILAGTESNDSKENTMSEQSATTSTLDPTTLRDILVTKVGIDREQLTLRPEASLADLGLDSMAVVELGVALRDEHGLAVLPGHTSTMSFDELAVQLCQAA